MKLLRFALLLLLLGASTAGFLRYADRFQPLSLLPSEVATTSETTTADPSPLAVDDLPLPPLPAVGPSDPLDAQALVIPPVLARSAAFTTRTLPAERLAIPSIGLESRVVPLEIHNDRSGALVWETAPFAVGHHRGSANPGEPGNVVLSGHISSPSEGSVFQRLPQVKLGDSIVIATAQQNFLYRVWDVQVVAPTATEFIEPTTAASATLVTCYPDRVYSHRLVVRAHAV